MPSDDYNIMTEYLYNNTGNHDKVYNITLRSSGRNYEVIGEWGPRLGVLRRSIKYTGPSLTGAREAYNSVISEKRNKGYRGVAANLSRATSATTIKLPEKKPKPIDKENQKYDPNYVPERRLDFDDL